jgi:hypothetical protein
MKKLVILIFTSILLLCNCFSVYSQDKKIEVDKSFFGKNYYINKVEIHKKVIVDMLQKNQYSETYIDSYKSSKLWGYLFLSAGLLLTAEVIYSGDTYYANFGTYDKSTPFILKSVLALGLNIGAIMNFSRSKYNLKKAIRVYNNNINSSDISYKLYITHNRLGFIAIF